MTLDTTELSSRFSGALLRAGDPGYDEARRIHNGMIDKRPALIARCLGTADIADAVMFARTHDLEVAVRGGGLGWLMGKHGLAADNLVAAEIVTASGEVLAASADDNGDLFWGLRGGGGNFGVVSWFQYRLHPVGPVTSGLVAHPFERARDVLRFLREVASSLPDALTLMGQLVHAPDGSGVRLAVIVACHAGSRAAAETALRPIRSFGAPLMDTIGPTSYEATNTMLDAGFPRGALNYWKSSFLTELSDGAIDTLVARFAACPSPMSGLVLEHFHGAATRVGVSDTAFPHRRDGYNLLIVAEWLDPGDNARNVAWARETYDAMKPYYAPGRYVNYLADDEGEDLVQAAYGPNHARLRALKAKYDPTNLFHLNQNIRPSV